MRIGGFRIGWLRRRWWVIAASVVLVTGIAFLVNRPTPTSYTSEAVLIVRSGATTNTPGSANEANRLAVTYSQLIPQDSLVLDRVSQTLSISRADVQKSLTVSNDANTSILRVRFNAPNSERAIGGARATADALAGSNPASANFNGVGLSSLPDTATAVSSSNTTLPVGVILGLALGVVLVLAWERSDGRIDDAEDLADELACPVTSLQGLSGPAIVALLDRWRVLAGDTPATVAVVTPAVGSQSLSQEVAVVLSETASDPANSQAVLVDSLKGLTLQAAGAPGTVEVGEGVVQRADLAVVVVPEGTSVRQLRSSIDVLKSYGVSPNWALYAGEVVVRRARRRFGRGETVSIDVGVPLPSFEK